MEGKDGGVKNREYAFNEDVAENGIIPSAIQTRAQILHEFLFQRMARRMVTLNQMVMVFINATGWTVWTLTRISAVKNMANRQDAMSPFDKEIGSAEVAVAHKGVDIPVDVTSK